MYHGTVVGNDQLAVVPAGDIESLRGQHQHVDSITLPANEEIVLENVKGNAMEIVAQFRDTFCPHPRPLSQRERGEFSQQKQISCRLSVISRAGVRRRAGGR